MAIGDPWSLLDQASGIHHPHCASRQGWPPAADITSEAMPADDAVVAYALEARRIYDALKRVIGQAAGLLIIAEASGKREVTDLPSLILAEERWREAGDRLAALTAPPRLELHRQKLQEAARLAGVSLAALHGLARKTATGNLTEALNALSSAYRHLQSASDSRFGLMMVDFRHSCCNCGIERH